MPTNVGYVPHIESGNTAQIRRRLSALAQAAAQGGYFPTTASTSTTSANSASTVPGATFQLTSPSTPDTEFAITHNLGYVPQLYFIGWKSAPADFYQGPSTGTPWTTSTIYLKCNAASISFLIFIQ